MTQALNGGTLGRDARCKVLMRMSRKGIYLMTAEITGQKKIEKSII